MDLNELKEILTKATEHMVNSLNSYGPSETLKLLLTYSNDDAILRELLTKFPSVVTTSLFLGGKPIIKVQVNAQNIERFCSESHFPIFTREESEEEERVIPKHALKVAKKTRCRKHRIRRGRGSTLK